MTAPSMADITAAGAAEANAHRLHSDAVARLRRAERELQSTFDDLYRARSAMAEQGITVDVSMGAAIGAAWDKFQAEKAARGSEPSPLASRRASRP